MESTFTCDACGAHGDLRLPHGGIEADQGGGNRRTLSLVPCPTCRHRKGRNGELLRVALSVAGTVVLLLLSRGPESGAYHAAVAVAAAGLLNAGYAIVLAVRAGQADVTLVRAGRPSRRPEAPKRERPPPSPPPRSAEVAGAASTAATPTPYRRPAVVTPADAPPFFPPPEDRGS